MAQRVKHLPEMQETWVLSPGQKDPLEKEMATHSSAIARKVPRTKEPGSLQTMGFLRQEYWSGLPFPSLEDLPDPGIEPRSPAFQADSLPFELQEIYLFYV